MFSKPNKATATANAALENATSGEAQQYRGWIIEVATEVAEAAEEDGVRVSQNEAALIERLQTALNH